MMGGGEFIINGSERVIVSQLHRSPGVDFLIDACRARIASCTACWIIPERGSWIELNVTKKENLLTVRIDQSGKFSADDVAARPRRGAWHRPGHPARPSTTTKVVKKTKSQTDNAFAKSITDKHRGGGHRRAEDG